MVAAFKIFFDSVCVQIRICRCGEFLKQYDCDFLIIRYGYVEVILVFLKLFSPHIQFSSVLFSSVTWSSNHIKTSDRKNFMWKHAPAFLADFFGCLGLMSALKYYFVQSRIQKAICLKSCKNRQMMLG
jgi:hypothetical protein